MKTKLVNFLTKLATDEKLVAEFKNNATKLMEKQGLSKEHMELVLNHKYDEIQKILGADFDVTDNTVVRAYRK